MKQTSEALSNAQDELVIRRHLLESGFIRLVPDSSKPAAKEQKQHQEDSREPSSRGSE